MTVFTKSPKSDPTCTEGNDKELKVDFQTVDLTSGTATVSFDADFESKPVVALTSGDNAGTALAISIDEDGTHDKDEVDIVGNDDETVQVIAIGE